MSIGFHDIRRRLLSQNRVTRYLLYAGGEILLVVAGILIAVQINNWNENRKLNAYEISLLEDILANLEEDGGQVASIIEFRKNTSHAITHLLQHLPGIISPIDSFNVDIARLYTFERYFPIRNAYEVSKSKGLQISNRQLRNAVARYYEYEQHLASRSIADIETVFVGELTPLWRKVKVLDFSYGTDVTFVSYELSELRPFLEGIEACLLTYAENHAMSLAKISEFSKRNRELQDAIRTELEQLM